MKLQISVVVKDFKNDSYFGASSYSNEGSYIIENTYLKKEK